MTSYPAITDFPDRLSPMVVKELRQGLRTRMFALVMVILHLLMVLFTLMSAAEDTTVVGFWFDAIITLVLCVILPLRGFSAVADEMKSGTLDMLALTSLSAGRIIFGKWVSIVSLSLLIALSLLPYVVARYVFGGIDLIEEVTMLGLKWLIGAVLAALIIALSTQRQFWLRAVIVGLPLLMGSCGMFSFFMMARMGGSAGPSFFGSSFLRLSSGMSTAMMITVVTLVAAWSVFFFLSLAATRIAPAASLLAVAKRGVHFVVFGTLLAIALASSTGGVATVAASVLWLVMMDALTEHANDVPSVYAAFERRGVLGRMAMWFLAPGWITGFFYTVLLVGLVAGTIWLKQGPNDALLVIVSACGIWMIGTLVHALPTRRARDLLLPFLCFWLGTSFLLSSLASLLIMPFSVKGTTAWFSSALPQILPIGYAIAPAGDKERLLTIGTLTSLIWPLLLLIAAWFAWRRTKTARQEARRMVQLEKGGVH